MYATFPRIPRFPRISPLKVGKIFQNQPIFHNFCKNSADFTFFRGFLTSLAASLKMPNYNKNLCVLAIGKVLKPFDFT